MVLFIVLSFYGAFSSVFASNDRCFPNNFLKRGGGESFAVKSEGAVKPLCPLSSRLRLKGLFNVIFSQIKIF